MDCVYCFGAAFTGHTRQSCASGSWSGHSLVAVRECVACCMCAQPARGGAQVQVAADCGHSLAALLSVYTLFCVCDVRMCLWTVSTDVVGAIVTSGR